MRSPVRSECAHHRDGGKEIRDGGEEADLERREPVSLDHLRQPEAHAVEPDHDAEIQQSEHQHARAGERLAELGIADVPRRLGLCREHIAERLPLLLAEPARIFRPVVEEFERDHAEDHRRQAFDDEEPLPALQPADPVQLEQRAGHRSADQGRERHRRHEQGDDARPLPRRKPISEIEDDAGEEARFRDAQEKAHQIETGRAADQGHSSGDDPPADHDARDPDARAESL
jgi:hypothetical protein